MTGNFLNTVTNTKKHPKYAVKNVFWLHKYCVMVSIVAFQDSLKIPERYEKCLLVSSSVKRKPLPTPPFG
jgi:hypothetical protein